MFEACGGNEWHRREGWCQTEDVRAWNGIEVAEDGRVKTLDLKSNNLKCDIVSVAECMLELPALEFAYLAGNRFTRNELQGRKDIPKLNELLAELSGMYVNAFFGFDETIVQEEPETLSFVTTMFVVDFGGHPLSRVYLSEQVLTAEQCSDLVMLAVQAAERQGGWRTKRHLQHASTDVDCSSDAQLLLACNTALEFSILPLLARLFELPRSTLRVEDLFVTKYSASAGEQASLGTHRDGSELSFVLLLNDPAEFEGGGTSFEAVEPALVTRPRRAGDLVAFCGQQDHGGVAVRSGARFILAGFVRVHDDRATKDAARELFCPCAGSTCAAKRRQLGQGEWRPWAPAAPRLWSSVICVA